MNIRKAIAAAFVPYYWRALSHAVVPTIEHKLALGNLNPKTVIDIGANKGQFSIFAAQNWPAAQIYAFEPLSEPGAKIAAILNNRVKLHRFALGNAQSQLDIHIASRADSSSLLPLANKQKQLFNMEEVGTIKIPVERLDNILKISDINGPSLMKIDVQGYEYQVLQGASALLPFIDHIFIECSFVELYEGQKLFSEINGMLIESGFEQIGQYNASYDENGDIVQADILFRNGKQ